MYERINHLIRQQNITKRKFAETLRNIQPKLKSTGEIPSEKTIYKYLSGDISIPIELVTYIAEVLNIAEQELFDTNIDTKIKLHKYISKGLSDQQSNYLSRISNNSSIVGDVQTHYKQKSYSEENLHNQEEIEKLFSLLEYAPKKLIIKIIKRLEEIKAISLKDI